MEPSDYAAWIALVLSLISIGWNIYTWRHNGARLSVTTSHAVVMPAMGNIRCLAITVVNRGRMATIINNLAILYDDEDRKLIFAPHAYPLGMEIPKKIEAGEEVAYFLAIDAMAEVLKANNISPKGLRVLLSTGHKSIEVPVADGVVTLLERALAQLDARESKAKQDGEAPRGKS